MLIFVVLKSNERPILAHFYMEEIAVGTDIAELIEDISSKIITFDLSPALYVFGPNFKKRP